MTATPAPEYLDHTKGAPLPAPNGRTTVLITCPWCGTATRAYTWSLAGGGKRCDGCGALHNSVGSTRRPK